MRRLILTVAALALVGCDKKVTEPDENEPDAIVTTIGAQFVPAFLDIPMGGTVRFDIGGNFEGHDVTFRPGLTGAPANVPVTLEGQVDRKFMTKGVFPYDCKVHPGMAGEITVK